MANQNAKPDQNYNWTLTAVTDDINAEIRRLLVDPSTGRLKCTAVVSGGVTGGIAIEQLTGTYDGAHFVFTCVHAPVWIFNDGTPNFPNIDYTIAGAPGAYTVTFLYVAPNAGAMAVYNK